MTLFCTYNEAELPTVTVPFTWLPFTSDREAPSLTVTLPVTVTWSREQLCPGGTTSPPDTVEPGAGLSGHVVAASACGPLTTTPNAAAMITSRAANAAVFLI
jgi:hypothetical protein